MPSTHLPEDSRLRAEAPRAEAPRAEALAEQRGAADGIALAGRILWSRMRPGEAVPEHRVPGLADLAGFDFSLRSRERLEQEMGLLGEDGWRWPPPGEGGRPGRISAADLEAVHGAYRRAAAAEKRLAGRYPLGVLVHEWQTSAPARMPRSGREGGVVPLTLARPDGRKWRWAKAASVWAGGAPPAGLPAADIPAGSAPAADAPRLAFLPSPDSKRATFAWEKENAKRKPAAPAPLKRSALLEMYDDPARRSRGGMALAPRLAHEVLLSLGAGGRRWTDTPTAVRFTVEELRRRMWPHAPRRAKREASQLFAAWMRLRSLGGYWFFDAAARQWRMRFMVDVHEFGEELDFWIHLPPGSSGGSWIHRPTLRTLGCESALAYRAYLTVSEWWDRYLTAGGRMLSPLRPKALRNAEGQLLGADGEVLLAEDGSPETRWARGRVLTSARGAPLLERNPEMDRLPPLEREHLIAMTHPEVSANPGTQRKQHERAARALEALAQPRFDASGRMLRDAVVSLERGRLPANRAARRRSAGERRPILRVLPQPWIVLARHGRKAEAEGRGAQARACALIEHAAPGEGEGPQPREEDPGRA